MLVVITRAWQVNEPTPAQLDPGQVLDVPESLAIYLFAMHCAARAHDVQTRTPEQMEAVPVRSRKGEDGLGSPRQAWAVV
jgi:hypothetical protein